MAELKREYVVPLRRKTQTAPKWRRSKRSVSVLKDFIRKHMKTEDVILCSELNEFLWSRGGKNPPGKVSVVALKKEIGGENRTIVNLQNVGLDNQLKVYEQPDLTQSKAPVKEDLEEKVQEAEVKEVTKKDDEKKEEVKESPKAENKEEKKNE